MAVYQPRTWTNNVTPLNQSNMNQIEQGIYQCSVTATTSMVVNISGDSLVITLKNDDGTTLHTYTKSGFLTQESISSSFTAVEIPED